MILISVLLVDDSSLFVHAATRFLQEQSEIVVVGAASRGEEALMQAQRLQPKVVLIDLNMPGLSGLKAIPLLRERLPDAGIIVLTLQDMDAYRQAALSAGADDFVSKATLVADLLPAIRRVVEARQTGRTPHLKRAAGETA